MEHDRTSVERGASLCYFQKGSEYPGLPVQVVTGYPGDLPFANHLCRLDALNDCPCRRGRPRPPHSAQSTFGYISVGQASRLPVDVEGLPRSNRRPAGARFPEPASGQSKHGPIYLDLCLQRKRSVIKWMAGLCRLIWSNLCTRHVPAKLTPRGRHDWPDKRLLAQVDFPDPATPFRIARHLSESAVSR